MLQQQIAQVSLQAVRPSRPNPTNLVPNVTPPTPQRPYTIASTWPAPAPTPHTLLTCIQILERVASIPQCPNTEEGKHLYCTDIDAWHMTHGQAIPSIEQPYPLTPGMAPVGSGECYGCGYVTNPPHTSGNCPAMDHIPSHESRHRQLVGGML